MANLPESTPDYHTERPAAFVTYLLDKGVGSFRIFRPIFTADGIVSMDFWDTKR